MSMTCNMEETIDSRDIIERIEELNSMDLSDLSEDEIEELRILTELAAEGSSECSDWEHGAILIRDTYFTDYAKEMLEDCGDLPRDLPWYIAIDWEETADNIKQDYVELDYDGATYYIQSC